MQTQLAFQQSSLLHEDCEHIQHAMHRIVVGQDTNVVMLESSMLLLSQAC